ncbi:MAG: AMP-binding protein, partial [Polyangiales bacterium]
MKHGRASKPHAPHVELAQLRSPQLVTPAVDTLAAALERAAAHGAWIEVARNDASPPGRTYFDVLASASHAAHVLLAQGVQRGDRVLLMAPTSMEWLAAFFGIALAGAVAVPIGPSLAIGGIARHVETVRKIAIDSGARLMIGAPYLEAQLGSLREGTSIERFLSIDALAGEVVDARPLPSADPDALAVLQYTSGTTGQPKGVMLTHRALLTNATMIGDRTAADADDVGVSWLPLFHDMGLVGALISALAYRHALLLLPVEAFLMQPRRWMNWLSRRRATMTVAPNFAYQLVAQRLSEDDARALDLSALRCAFDGAEQVRSDTLRAFEARLSESRLPCTALQPVYGLAENTLAATFPERGARWRTRPRLDAIGGEVVSVGTPLAGVTVRIVDEKGAIVSAARSGAIELLSPSLMRGYFRDEEASERALHDGWLRTGDVGFVEGGELFVTGRAKELIIKRGTNYHPDDLERVAMEAGGDDVRAVAAFGCADASSGTE